MKWKEIAKIKTKTSGASHLCGEQYTQKKKKKPETNEREKTRQKNTHQSLGVSVAKKYLLLQNIFGVSKCEVIHQKSIRGFI